jgi:hypothetical protein
MANKKTYDFNKGSRGSQCKLILRARIPRRFELRLKEAWSLLTLSLH